MSRSSLEEATFRLGRPISRALALGHPWVYREGLSAPPLVPAGTVVRLVDGKDRFVAWGLAEDGPLALRVFSLRREMRPSPELFATRVALARALRQGLIGEETNAYRLLHGEGDGLPGAVCDIYDRWAVLKFDSAAWERWQGDLLDALVTELGAALEGVVLRGLRGEGRRAEVIYGSVPDEPVTVREHGMKLRVDLRRGQKTGLFLDHRESRRRVRQLAQGRRVLNLYAYTGGFSVAAALGGAKRVDTVDVAAPAIAFARQAFADNGVGALPHALHVADVPQFLKEREGSWDLIVADPPSFAPNERAKPKALRSYRALHRACLRRLKTGALYLAASCSSHVDVPTFEQTLRDAAEKTRTRLQVLERWGAPGDHPRLLAFPEGDYLKVILCRVL